MKILLKAPGIHDRDLEIYLTDALRNPTLLSARGWRHDIVLWRGTRTPEEFPDSTITSWTDSYYDARQFGRYIKIGKTHEILAVVEWTEDDGRVWHEFVTKETT